MREFPATRESPLDNPARWKYYSSGLNIYRGNPHSDYASIRAKCSSLPNCTSYCYGRALETWGEYFDDRKGWGHAMYWYGNAPSTYRIGFQAVAGSIAVFSSSAYGHVIFIERVNGDGTWDFSDSSYGLRSKGFAHLYHSNVAVGSCGYWGYTWLGSLIPPNIDFSLSYLENKFYFTANQAGTMIEKKEWR